MAEAGLYALGFVILLDLPTMGAGFVLWDLLHVQPDSLPASVS
jgi:hypothetical protein